jgi:predicted RNase H-like nuclease (RuvC/YqgF family)
MSRSTSILGVLLGASLLANAMLAVRLSKAPEPQPTTVRKTSVAAADPAAEPAALRESLEAERKKNEELKAKIERLETDKKVLAQDGPAPGKADKLEAFRAKLRKLMKLMKDPAAKAGNLDPDAMVEATEVMMDFFRMSAMRSKEPKAYADYLQAFYEVGLEGEGTALTEAQTSSLSKLLQDLGQDLARIPATPTGEKLIKEIELEAAAMARVNAVLTDAQRTAITKENMNALAAGNMMSTSYVPQGPGAVDQIAQQWTAAYQLDPAQQAQAKVAAQAYLDAMKRAPGKFSFEKQGTTEHFDYRLRSAREQLAALQMLQASMTPAQQERVRTQTMRELLLFDAAGTAADAVVPPSAEK